MSASLKERVESRNDARRDEKKDQFRTIRQWLNIVFMAGAVGGFALYELHSPQSVGIIVILSAMVFKIVECALRFIK